MKIEVEIDEGDILKFNDVWWSVQELRDKENEVDMLARNSGRVFTYNKDEIEEKINFSGQIRFVKQDYKNVVDY